MSDLRQWVPDEAIEQLTVRRALQNVEDPIKMAVDLIKESLPLTTMSMTHLAVHCPVDSVRFQAARYIMDKALGEGKDLKLPDNARAWDKIFDSVMVEVDGITKGAE